MNMMLATTKIEDFDQFLKIFSTKGAEKRKQHGSKGAAVFRDPVETDRVWVIFDWDEQGFKNFVSDPEVPAILKEAGHVGKPQAAVLGGKFRPSARTPGAAPASSAALFAHRPGRSGARRTAVKLEAIADQPPGPGQLRS
jgi:hypothetical protein